MASPVSRHARVAVAVFTTIWLALAVGAAHAQDTFTPQHVAKIRTVASAAVSPDGGSIAYTVAVPRRPLVDDDGGPWDELHLVGPDGVPRPLVTGENNLSSVQFTPDGKGLSFLARRGKDTTRALYVLPLAGGEAQRVLGHETGVGNYTWSPDGKRVAFVALEAAPKARRDLEKKGFTQDVYEESVPLQRVWVDTIDDEAPARMLDLKGSASLVTWSPAGNHLALALAPTALVDDDYMARTVHVVDVGTGAVVASLANAGKLGTIEWSPDGRTLALISAADINDPSAGRLLVAPSGGGPLRDVLPGYKGHVSAVAWSGAGTMRFIGDEGTATVIGEVRADGTARRTIVPAGSTVFTGVSASRDGQAFALIGQAPTHPSEVFRLDAKATEPARLTTTNPWLAKMRFAKQEVVTFKARDGVALEGVLVRPLDEQPGRRYPLVLTVHGGPEAHDRNGWVTSYANLGQVGAAFGFAVFYPNYRGSTGRGVEFSKLGQGDPAGKEFDDLVDAVDHLASIGLVDTTKVGITGGSYGGYATGWCSTYYTDRFAAGVMFVGISDVVSKAGTTDIANEEYYVHALKRPWESWQFFLERSPIYYAAKSKTPLLILGGTDDPRVHPSQSLEMYRYMKLHGKTVRLVRYPGEHHGNRRAASRFDYNVRLLQWMEHYLQGPGGEMPPMDVPYGEAAGTARQ